MSRKLNSQSLENKKAIWDDFNAKLKKKQPCIDSRATNDLRAVKDWAAVKDSSAVKDLRVVKDSAVKDSRDMKDLAVKDRAALKDSRDVKDFMAVKDLRAALKDSRAVKDLSDDYVKDSEPNLKKNVNCYKLSLTFKAGFRPLEILKEGIEPLPYFSIHCLSPSRLYKLAKQYVILDICDDSIQLNSSLPEVEIDSNYINVFKRYWPCLNKLVNDRQFYFYQKNKHGSAKTFEGDFLVAVVNVGKPIIDNIQWIFDYYGYQVGGRYNCRELIDRLMKHLKFTIDVVFVPHKHTRDHFHLISIVALLDTKLKTFNHPCLSATKITNSSVFILQNLKKKVNTKRAGQNENDNGKPQKVQRVVGTGNQVVADIGRKGRITL